MDFVNDINGTFNVISNLETYPIFYGEAPSGYQDYIVTFDSYGKEEKQLYFRQRVAPHLP